MSISTGDSRHSAPKKSTTAAGGASPDAAPADEPVGGVLPVKKVRAGAAGRPGSGGRAGANGKGRTDSGGSGAPKANGAAKDSSAKGSSGSASSAAKSTPAKSTPAKSGSAAKPTSPAKSTSAATSTSPAKSATAKPASGPKAATKPKVQSALVGGGKRGSALTGGKGGGRRPVTPVRVAQTRNWGPIILYVATGLVALAIIGISVFPVIQNSLKGTWREQAAAIPGLINYIDPDSATFDASVTSGIHQTGQLTYPMSPPVGGPHNGRWQNCMGDVYTSEIAKEHAVHSLEHGAVWITYHPDLPQDQIDKLARRVEGRDYMLMSPFPDLDAKISLQAWGYQLKVDDADDSRIDDFISALRHNASQEEGAVCHSGITDATPVPLDFGEGMS